MGVFLTEHPTFVSAPRMCQSRHRKGQGHSYHGEAKTMAARQQNHPNVQFCIEVRTSATGDVVDRYTIEQVTEQRRKGVLDMRLWNAIQSDLHAHHKRTGLHYHLVEWGEVKDRSAWLAGGPLNPQLEIEFSDLDIPFQ